MIQALAVFIGGGLGSLARYGISLWIKTSGFELPLATLLANVLSTTILGLAVVKLAGNNQSLWFAFLAIGFCGGFSTFSTFSYETLALLRSGQLWWAILNVVVSVALCLFILFALLKSME